MRNYTWADRRYLPAGSNWLKLGGTNNERILRSRGYGGDRGLEDTMDDDSSVNDETELGLLLAFMQLLKHVYMDV